MQMLKSNQSGAASMITVIFVSIVLTILSLGFIRLAINEQRASTDDDLSTRAYFAAESGLEDVKRALREVQQGTLTKTELNGDVCENPNPSPDTYDPVLSPPDVYDIEYTCQIIDLTPSNYEHHFDGANQTIQFPIFAADANGNLLPGSGFTRLIIEWHMNAEEGDDGDGLVGAPGSGVIGRSAAGYTPSGNQPDTYSVSRWLSDNYPAMLRANIFSHRKTPSWGRDDIRNYVVFLDPVNGGSGDAGSPWPDASPNFKGGQLIDGNCDPGVATGEMFCTAEFNYAPSNRQWYFRLTSLYRGTHIRVKIYQGGLQRFFDGVQAVADVTGRAGEVYRRVESRISLVHPSIFPDAALTSLNDICKDFFITDLLTDFDGLVDPATGRGTSCTIP